MPFPHDEPHVEGAIPREPRPRDASAQAEPLIGTAVEGGTIDAYRELFERSADAILIIEGDRFIDCNQATVDMLRYRDKAQLLETHPSELSPPTQPDGRDSREKANEIMERAFEQGSARFEWDHMRADGEVFPVEVLLTAIREPGRKVLHVVWRDIAERKRLEAELRQAQRTEAIGKLAGGIAHDFNNLLVILVGNADLLKLHLANDPKAIAFVDQIVEAGERASELVQQLLAFSRRQEVLERVFDVNALVRRTEGLLRRLIGEDINLVTDTGTPGLNVVGDGGQIEQVLLNLASNARDAMPQGGTLTIETSAVPADRVPGGAAGGKDSFVLIAFTDTGTGMSAEALERAFDPFFTTKEQGKGTGLGLATVYGIAKQAGGHTRLRSELGRGTTVEVYLPLSHEQAADVEPVVSAKPLVSGTETLLLVEDEEGVAALLLAVLERAGYTVLTASNGSEALELYTRRADEIDLIVTDVIMPVMGGAELISTLRARGHEPRVLFISGYTDNELSRLDLLDEGVDLLRKPFHTEALARRVHEALARA